MYAIYRDNKRFNNKLFASYEAARNYARGWINKHFGSRVLRDFGFSIQKREGNACPN
jgi:hypothetical protein